ncbi:AsmA-like C-terminal region-containing protein [Rapidithrix thailandica]|uniref:AsmA-like C-terminal region-containing protein n=1 Tax=Rapidithrix thailandica TaxID=413964 RepID=A0AAW9S0P8_9BACT
MKKFFIIFGSIILVFFALALILPVIFKDDIKAIVDEQIDKNIDAHVYFDADKFDISLFKHFPHLSVSLGDFGIVGKNEFEGDTLTNVEEFSVAVNVLSAVFGEQIEVEQVLLENPYVHVIVLDSGQANYDIFISSEEETSPEEESESSASAKINGWAIENGHIIYDDRSLATYVDIQGLNHEGSGDFSAKNFDISTQSTIDSLTVEYENVQYFQKSRVDAELVINADLPSSTYTFKDNYIKVNDFTLGFEGWFKMPEEGYEMDLSFATKENDFKNILSLVPGVFLEGFEDIKTEGSLAFDGQVKGTYSEERNLMPGYKLNLQVKDGMFQYPDLPTPVKNVQIDMLVDNMDGVMENILLDLKNLHLDIGSNPVEAKATVKGYPDSDIQADMKATLNLGELSSAFPMDEYELKGIYSLFLKANGVYSDANKTIPQIDANMSLKNGYVKYTEYPIPMENMEFAAKVSNTSGKMNDTQVLIENVNMLVDGEPLTGSGKVYNLDDITYTFDVNGTFNLDMIDKIYPMDDMKLAGKIVGQVQTSGKMSDIEAERYDKLPTSGKIQVSDFLFEGKEYLAHPFKINSANLVFNPKEMVLQNYNGSIGKSDMQLTGKIANYIGYMLSENAVLKGNFAMTSKYFDTNEWMEEEEETSSAPTEEETYEVVPIPKNLDFVFNATIDKVDYTNLELNNLTGKIAMKDGIMSMSNVKFDMLGGKFAINGAYNTSNPEKPGFEFDMNIEQLSFKKSYESFNTIQAFAPVAKSIDGFFSSGIKIKGALNKDYSPIYETLTGGGDIFVNNAQLKDVKILNKISDLTKIKELNNPALKDVMAHVTFKDGKMHTKPFDVKMGNINATVGGSTSFDGKLDYNVKTKVPAKYLGSSLASQYSNLTGKDEVLLSFNVGGSYDSPKIGRNKGEESEANKALEGAKEKGKEAAKDLVQDLLNKDKKEGDSTSTTPKEKVEEATDKLKDLIKNPFKKKKDN